MNEYPKILLSFGEFLKNQGLCSKSDWDQLTARAYDKPKDPISLEQQPQLPEDLKHLITKLQEIYTEVLNSVKEGQSVDQSHASADEDVVQGGSFVTRVPSTDSTSARGITKEGDERIVASCRVPADLREQALLKNKQGSGVVQMGSTLNSQTHGPETMRSTPSPLEGSTQTGESKVSQEPSTEYLPAGMPPSSSISKHVDHGVTGDGRPEPQVDPELVQITASKSEIERRVQAFQDHKRLDVNEVNIREFCSAMSAGEVSESCARADAIFLKRPNSKSHVKVSRAVNQFGPQTRCHTSPSEPPGDDPRKQVSCDVMEGLEERLSNMEEHVSLPSGSGKRKSFYERLKVLEERILHLESLSPEYFSLLPPSKRRKGTDTRKDTLQDDNVTLPEINEQMKALRKSLGIK